MDLKKHADAENNSDQVYCFTWCPNSTFHVMPTGQQFKETFKLLRKIRYSLEGHYKIYPELTINGNIHYHGMFAIKNKVHWFKTSLPLLKRYGFVRVDKVKPKIKDKWQRYIQKDCKDMMTILDLDQEQFDEDGLSIHYKQRDKQPFDEPKPTIWDILHTDDTGQVEEARIATLHFMT